MVPHISFSEMLTASAILIILGAVAGAYLFNKFITKYGKK